MIEPQNRRLGAIECIARVQRIVPEIFKQAAVESVAAALGDEADLPAASGAKLRRVVAGIHAKLLHVFQAGLQPKDTAHFAADVARVVANDAAGFNAIVAQRVLLEGAAVEANVVEGSSPEIHGAGRHKVKLGNLAAVDGQISDLALADVAADSGGPRINCRLDALDDQDGGGQCGELHREVAVDFLPHGQLKSLLLRGSKFLCTYLDRIKRGLQCQNLV